MAKLPEMTVYFNQKMAISLAVPVGWTGKVIDKTAFHIYGPQEAQYNNYRAALTVEKLDLEEDSDGDEVLYDEAMMAELIVQAQEDLKSEMQGFKSLREERYTNADGLPAYLHWFEWQDPESGQAYSQIQGLVLTAAGSLYIFNASTLKPLENAYISTFNHIIRSAHITA